MQKRILLFEDEDIRDFYKEILDAAGFMTDAFATGEAGLKAFHENQYDLVILDIILPDMNGLKILKQIKETENKADIPVIILTNLDEDIILRQGFQLGAADYLMKVSVTPDQIIKKVKLLVEERKSP